MPAEKPSAPRVKIGDIVMWRLTADPARPASPAIVTRVADNDVISVSVIPFDSPVLQPKDAVRHIDDPRHKQFATVLDDSGTWSLH